MILEGWHLISLYKEPDKKWFVHFAHYTKGEWDGGVLEARFTEEEFFNMLRPHLKEGRIEQNRSPRSTGAD